MTYTQAMSVSDMITEVKNLRFSNGDSTQIQRWINDRYAMLWNMEEWIFKYAKVSNIGVTNGSTAVSSLPTDFGIALGFWRADGFPLRWMPPKNYQNLYYGATDTGSPEFYTAINQSLLVGPPSNETSSTYSLLYEKRLTALVNSSDTPAIPAEHHYLLPIGACALGCALNNDFTYQFLEQQWQEGIAAMRQEWLNDQRGDVTQWGRDDVEALPTFWGV